LQHVFRAKGIQNLDWRAGRQRQATPGRGSGTLADLERVDAIVEIGESPAERAPIMDLRVRKAAFQKGAKLIRIASLETPYPPPIPSVDVATVADAIRELPKDAKRVALVWDGVDLDLGKSLVNAIPNGIEIVTYITGEQPNARGAETLGMLPRDGGMDTSAMLAAARDGNLAVLSIFGANPALHYPDGAFVREALRRVPFIVVSELFMTETAQLATLVLPAKGPFEKIGTTTNLTGDVLPVNDAKGLETPPGALSDLEMLIGLAEQLGVSLPVIEDVDAAVIAKLAAEPEPFTFGDDRFARIAQERKAGEGLRVVLQTRIFAGGGTSAHDDRLPELRPLPEAAISAQDAAQLGLKTCDYIDLESDGRTMHDLLVEVRANMPAGAIALIGGLPDDPANLFGEGALVRISNIRKADAALVEA
jgi:predicted molibdopterin-dependent oxidoreductase YjgC